MERILRFFVAPCALEPRMVGRDSVEPTFERSEASAASISQRVRTRPPSLFRATTWQAGPVLTEHASGPETIRARRSLALPQDMEERGRPVRAWAERFMGS